MLFSGRWTCCQWGVGWTSSGAKCSSWQARKCKYFGIVLISLLNFLYIHLGMDRYGMQLLMQWYHFWPYKFLRSNLCCLEAPIWSWKKWKFWNKGVLYWVAFGGIDLCTITSFRCFLVLKFYIFLFVIGKLLQFFKYCIHYYCRTSLKVP